MAFEPPVAVYDACVLYPFHLRNLLVQCAFDRLVEAHWTDQIHDEWIRNLAANAPDLPLAQLHAARDLTVARAGEAIYPVFPGEPARWRAGRHAIGAGADQDRR